MSTTPIKATEDLEKIAREAQKVADSAIAAASAPAALRPGEFEAAFSEFSASKPLLSAHLKLRSRQSHAPVPAAHLRASKR